MIIRISTDGTFPEEYLALDPSLVTEQPQIELFPNTTEVSQEVLEHFNNFLSQFPDTASTRLKDVVIDVFDPKDPEVSQWAEPLCEFCMKEKTTTILKAGDKKLYSCGDDCYKRYTFLCAWCNKLHLPNSRCKSITDYIPDGKSHRTFRHVVCISCYKDSNLECCRCSNVNITSFQSSKGALCANCEKELIEYDNQDSGRSR